MSAPIDLSHLERIRLDKLAASRRQQPDLSQAGVTPNSRIAPRGPRPGNAGLLAARAQASLAARVADNERRRLDTGIDCLACDDTGRQTWDQSPCRCALGQSARDAQEAARQTERRASIVAALGIPTRFTDCTLESYPNQRQAALKGIRRWLAAPDKPGLYLYGPFGRGKTGLIIGVLRALAESGAQSDGYQRALGSWGAFITGTALLESLRPNAIPEPEVTLRRYQSVRYLALDDLGAERVTAWGGDRLFELVNARHNALAPMLITSNLSPDELVARINTQVGDASGNRIVERLVESCAAIQFSDRDTNWRKQ